MRVRACVVRLIGVLTLLAARAGTAQQPAAISSGTLRGVVQDTSGRPLALVQVSVTLESPRATFTDSAGRFEFTDLPAGVHRFSFRRVGFVRADFDLMVLPGDTRSVTVLLDAAPVRLDTIAVVGRMISMGLEGVGFYQRQQQAREGAGVGIFITPEEMETYRVLSRTSHVLEAAGRVRLLHVEAARAAFPVGTRNVILSGAFGRIQTGPCQMAVFIDGSEVDFGEYWAVNQPNLRRPPPGGLDAFIQPTEIQAIEVYHSASGTPVQFQSTRRADCGSIVIWTKRARAAR